MGYCDPAVLESTDTANGLEDQDWRGTLLPRKPALEDRSVPAETPSGLKASGAGINE